MSGAVLGSLIARRTCAPRWPVAVQYLPARPIRGGSPVRMQDEPPAPPVNANVMVKLTKQNTVSNRCLAAVGLMARRVAENPVSTYAKDSGWGMFILPLVQYVYGDIRTPLMILTGAVGFVLLIALVFGVLGALLALFLQKIAIAVLGFLAGGKLAAAIAAAFFVHYAQYSTIIFVLGGIIGAILLLAVFNWALIVVSSFIGAYLIQSAIVLPPIGSTLVFVALAIIGILVQAASFRRTTI